VSQEERMRAEFPLQNNKTAVVRWVNGPPYLSVGYKDNTFDPAKPDDIRAKGWAVAVHNDYNLDGVPHTFWLFTKGLLAVKGEGLTDEEALDQVRAQIKKSAVVTGLVVELQNLGPENRRSVLSCFCRGCCGDLPCNCEKDE